MDRVDVIRSNTTLAVTSVYSRVVGSKNYELTDHLGNVRAVVGDIKIPSGMNFTADMKSASDYYPFGMALPARGYQSAEYRYGYNGKEKDDEVKGEGNSYDYGARIYDSRLGRFLTLDPMMKKTPYFSPYVYAANTPIMAVDEKGEYPLYKHFLITYLAMVKAGVSKSDAITVAHMSSTYADNPGKDAPLIWGYNSGRMMANSLDASLLSYNEKKYGSYETTENSQSDKLIKNGVSLHAMRAYWEDISPGEAVDRAVYGGTFKEIDGTIVHIEGAENVINRFRGRGFDNLSMDEKKEVGLALHTIQDAQVHQGGRWIAPDHIKDGKEKGSNQHPNVGCTTGANINGAKIETSKAVDAIENGSEYKFELHNIKLHHDD